MSDQPSPDPTCPLLSTEERERLTHALSHLEAPETVEDAVEALADLYLTPD